MLGKETLEWVKLAQSDKKKIKYELTRAHGRTEKLDDRLISLMENLDSMSIETGGLYQHHIILVRYMYSIV